MRLFETGVGTVCAYFTNFRQMWDSLRLFQAAVGTDHRKIDDEIEFLIRIIEEKPSFWSLKDPHSVSLFEDKIKF